MATARVGAGFGPHACETERATSGKLAAHQSAGASAPITSANAPCPARAACAKAGVTGSSRRRGVWSGWVSARMGMSLDRRLAVGNLYKSRLEAGGPKSISARLEHALHVPAPFGAVAFDQTLSGCDAGGGDAVEFGEEMGFVHAGIVEARA